MSARRVISLVAIVVSLIAGNALAQHIVPSALLTIDQNRATVVDRIVGEWGDRLAASTAGVSSSQLREILSGLRADHLLAASLGGSVEGLRDVVSGALVHTDAAVSPGLMHTKSLGDTGDDLVYTPIVPCRILDTRNGTTPPYNAQMVGGSAFPVAANLANFAPQGGSATSCGLPASFSAIAVTLTVLNPNFDAFLAASNSSNFATLTQSVVMDFSADKGLANTATVPVDGMVKFYLGMPAQVTTHVIADIAGYFKTPGGGYVTSVATGAGLTGGPITLTGTVGLATTQLLPTTACAGNQVPQWNGSAWTCATVTGGGTVTSVGTGSGLTGGPITTTGTVNLAVTNLLPTTACGLNQIPKWTGSAWACGADNDTNNVANDTRYFKQGGNFFGTDASAGTSDNFAFNIRVNGSRVARYEPNVNSPNLIGGNASNSPFPGVYGASIAGDGTSGTSLSVGGFGPLNCAAFIADCGNHVSDAYGFVGGGVANEAGDGGGTFEDRPFAAVGGGFGNRAAGEFSTVSGGYGNYAGGQATVSGGNTNHAAGGLSAIAGGGNNLANGDYSAVLGGGGNSAYGAYAVVVGGSANVATGIASVAMGTAANAGANGCFVFSDNVSPNATNCSLNTFVARATGGVTFITSGTSQANYNGLYVPAGGGSWIVFSDRDGKKAFETVDVHDVMERVVQLPMTTWQWKAESGHVRHIGPMAQDFYAAFGLGHDDKGIATVDEGGVALAAIQGLHQLVQEKGARIAALEQQVAELRSLRGELAVLRETISELANNKTRVARSDGSN